jgi:alpha-L-rhamnosidase
MQMAFADLMQSRNTTLNESWSSDGGKTWSEMKASALPNNNSGTDAGNIKRWSPVAGV